MTCATSECPNEPKKAGRCWRCVKHRRRHGSYPSGPPRTYANPYRTFTENVHRYADAAEADAEEFERAKAALRMASLRRHRKPKASHGQ